MIFKLILLFSVILTDKFNPVQGSFDECTEHPQCINEGFTDGNCCPNDSGTYQSCCFQAECLVNPKCFAEGQTGYCCPDVNGIYKECCNDDPTPAPVIDAECSAYPACAARGLEGQCCPATDGTMLSMSYFICNIRGKTSFIYTLRAKHFFFIFSFPQSLLWDYNGANCCCDNISSNENSIELSNGISHTTRCFLSSKFCLCRLGPRRTMLPSTRWYIPYML